MFRTITMITLTIALSAVVAGAQEVWSLEKCINYARQNSLRVKQAQYTVEQARLGLRGNQLSRLPNVNANLSGGYNFGKSVNPTTNQFESNRNFSGTGSVSGGVILYDGFRINNSVKQGRLDIQASQLEMESTANDISLLVASAYLNILLAQEQLTNARTRLALSQQQLDQIDKQIRAGTVPENDRLDFLAQIARDERTIVDAENLVEINYLDLKQLMEIDPNTEIRVVAPEDLEIPADVQPDGFIPNDVFATALNTQPQIRAGDLRLESAGLQEKIARANIMPRLSLFANLNTRFFNLTTDPTKGEQIITRTDAPVLINGEQAIVSFFQPSVINAPRMSFFDQLNNFFGQGVGLGLSIPIYNNHQNIIAIERARLSVLNQEVINRQARQTLKTNVQRAVANARASQRSIAAAERSLTAARAAYDNAQKRFDLGSINSLEYTTARNNLDQAEVELTRAKYQYLFDLKVVDFYQGRQLTLN